MKKIKLYRNACNPAPFMWTKTLNIMQYILYAQMGFLGGSDGKESICNAERLGSIAGSGRSLEEGNGYPLQYYCLENSMDRGAWWATICGITKSQIWLGDYIHTPKIVIVWADTLLFSNVGEMEMSRGTWPIRCVSCEYQEMWTFKNIGWHTQVFVIFSFY